MSSRSAPTATTRAPYVGSATASSRAARFDPVPLTRTTSRAGDRDARTVTPSGPAEWAVGHDSRPPGALCHAPPVALLAESPPIRRPLLATAARALAVAT